MNKVGRNAPCPCGSGKKYKKCCQVYQPSKELLADLALGQQRVREEGRKGNPALPLVAALAIAGVMNPP